MDLSGFLVLSDMDNYSGSAKLNRGVKPFGVIWKALLLFVAFELLLSLFPGPGYFVFKQFMPKLDKFPIYVVNYDPQSKHGFDVQNIFDINTLLLSHIISSDRKPQNQYRVVFIGDSTVNRGDIYSIVDQQHCDGKILHAYNLGYPGVSAIKDLMILQEAMKYAPDLIVWSVTYSISQKLEGFLLTNSDQLKQLINTYHLSPADYNSYLKPQSVIGGSNKIRLETYLILNYVILNPATGGKNSVAQIALNDETGSRQPLDTSGYGGQLYSTIQTLKGIAKGVPVLLIDEPRPSFIVDQEEDVQFRNAILSLSRKDQLNFLDLWNLVPDQGFLDRIHRNPEGEMLFDRAAIPAILEIACGQK